MMSSVTENMRKTYLQLRSIFRRNLVEAELDEELRFHLEYQTRENMARGMEDLEARRRAFLALDGLERCKEECRDMRRVNLIDDLFKDLAYAARTLRKSPAFVAAAGATIALGIGASTTVFSVVNAVLLRPLPYRDSTRLVLVLRDNPARSAGVAGFLYSNADFMDLRRGTTGLFEGLGGVASFRAFVPREDGATEQIGKALVTANFFRLLGARVVLGRDFTEADAAPEPPRPGILIPNGSAAILSYEYWQRRYGGNPGVLGTEMPGSGQGGPRIVGVLAPGFRLFLPPAYRVDAAPDFFVANNGGYDASHRNLLLAGAIARLKAGITLPQARERIRAMSPELQKAAFDRNAVLKLESMRGYLVKQERPAILALMGSVIFLMLIACGNVANLLLVRASQRERELAVRAALGGSAWRLMRQMLAEAGLISALGTLIGVALAWAGIRELLRVAPANLPRIESTAVDWHVLAFAALAGLGAAAVFGLMPAWRAVRPNVIEILRGGGRSSGSGSGRLTRNVVVVAEVALSFVLLVGSGLMLRSFLELQRVDPGFDPHHVLTFSVTRDWPLTKQEGRLALLREIQTRLRALPGVESVTAGLFLPLTRSAQPGSPAAPRPPAALASSDGADFQQVLPGYFETLRTPLLAGRTFTDQDNATGRNVVIIDQFLAARAFPNQPAVGKRIRVPFPDMPLAEVIGVAAPQRSFSLADPGRETIYFPEGAVGIGVSRSWAIRTAGDPAAMAPAVRANLARIDPALVITKVQTMETLVDRDQSGTRFSLLLIGFFAAIAVLLSAVGIYGVLASAVRQRTSEMGIRMALGAAPARIFKTVVTQGLALSAAGVALGLAAAFELTRALTSMLVGIQPTDPATFAGITVLFFLIAALACWLPARRAASLDPAEALRAE
jgi:putative ABC transport system permease protein